MKIDKIAPYTVWSTIFPDAEVQVLIMSADDDTVTFKYGCTNVGKTGFIPDDKPHNSLSRASFERNYPLQIILNKPL